MGAVVGRTLPVGHTHTARPAFTLRGTRKRADRIRELGHDDLHCFRLAATTAAGDTFWWTAQLPGSPARIEERLVFTFVALVLVAPLELAEWRLVDDGGYLVRLRRLELVDSFPVGHRIDAAYLFAFDGSDKRT